MAVTSTASTVTSTKVLSARAGRRGFVVENSDANRCYLLMDSGTASATNFSFSLAQNENAGSGLNYSGEINAMWAGAGSGALKVTEW